VKSALLDPAYEKLQSVFMRDLESFVKRAKAWTSIRNSCFLVALLVAYFIFVKSFIATLNQKIWQTKSLLNIVPPKFLLNNPDLKKQLLPSK